MNKIKIQDTTLRDGEQSPGFSMSPAEKLLFAAQLEKLKVDVIQAGFPICSLQDFEAVKLIAQMCTYAEVSGLCRCQEKDIELTMRALENAKKPRIDVFIAVSDLHITHKLGMTKQQVIEVAAKSVSLAKSFTPRVKFGAEDASRADRQFLLELVNAVVEAGADTINLPDTIGYSTPEEYGNLIAFLKKNVVGVDKVILSVHCHNDLGLAVSNSLAGVLNGARQVECTINGIGERAGNASLEEIVMALKVRREYYQAITNIVTTELLTSSRLLSDITGYNVPPNKAVVGKNAFSHAAGIHQHGILTNRSSYELFKPEEVGTENFIYLSKHSGHHGITYRLKQLGIELPPEEVENFSKKYKALAEKKKQISDEDLLVMSAPNQYKRKFELISFKTSFSSHFKRKMHIVMRIDNLQMEIDEEGFDPIIALCKGISRCCNLPGYLKEFSFRTNAVGDKKEKIVNIVWAESETKIWEAEGVKETIIAAIGNAMINLVNARAIKLKIKFAENIETKVQM